MTESQITEIIRLANRVAIARVRRYAHCCRGGAPGGTDEVDRRVAESVTSLQQHLEKEFPCLN